MGERFWELFFEIYESIPRQGPGDRASTERALAMLPRLGADQRLLDLGCGSGAQTLDLARASSVGIVAVDVHEPFIRELQARLERAGLAARVEARVGNMNDLSFTDASFDVVWCEGAIFILGFAAGLTAWRRLIKPGGHLVVSDLVWLTEQPLPEVEAFFLGEGGDITSIDARRSAIRHAGYELVDDFVLPHVGWWDNYYVPLEAAVADFRIRHVGDDEALAVAERIQTEITIYREHPEAFGYGFFVMQRPD